MISAMCASNRLICFGLILTWSCKVRVTGSPLDAGVGGGRASAPSVASAPGAVSGPNEPSAPDAAQAPHEPEANAPTPMDTIFDGTSGGIRVSWSKHDITIYPGAGAAPVSLAQRFRTEHGAENLENEGPCRWEDRVSVLSVVGPVVSLERKMYSECARAAHPGGETRYMSLRAKAGGGDIEAVDLSGYFEPSVLFAALSKDTVVRRAIASQDQSQGPGRVAGVAKELGGLLLRIADVELDEPCASFPSDILNRFAIHHVDHSNVAVRIGLPGSGPCRQKLTTLGLLLPMPPPLSAVLAAAESQREGFLMKDSARIAKGRVTLIVGGGTAEAIDRARDSLP
jgi:hypothetical protein